MSQAILIVGALKNEIAELKKRLKAAPHSQHDGTHSFEGQLEARPVILAYTGIGEAATRVGLQELVTKKDVALVVGIGFAGALVDGLKTGDIVVATEVCRETASAGQLVIRADGQLVRLAERVLKEEAGQHEGRLVTVEHALTDEAQKRATAERTQAIAVDMESAALASFCQERSIPFIVVRSILDPVEATVPDPAAFMDPLKGVSPKKLTTYLLKNPQSVWQLPQLAHHAKQARRSLTTAVLSLMQEMRK